MARNTRGPQADAGNMSRDLQGKVALVTGGARRLGRSFVEALAARGMVMAVHHSHSAAAAHEVVEAIMAAGGKAASFEADLTDAAAAMALPARVVERFGGLDLLVNSAAVMERRTLADTTPADWDHQLDLNLRAPFLLAQQAASELRQSRGTIINIADLSAMRPWAAYPVHSISKAGIVMLTKVLALILAPEVTVNGIAPGTVLLPESFDDEQRRFLAETTPLGRLGSPDDAIEALLYLVERGPFVTGETIVVDGGRSLGR